LRNVEQDEAGRLRAFRARFGRGWDLDAQEEEGAEDATIVKKIPGKGINEGGNGEEEGSLMDLISGAGETYRAMESRRAEKKEVEEKKVQTRLGKGEDEKSIKTVAKESTKASEAKSSERKKND
jgi:hypothetical protein